MAEQAQANIEEALQTTVNQIWEKYDKDGNNTLDKSEMRKFVQETMTESGINKTISDEDFETIFNQFDIDGSQTIERDEMAVLVKKMAGMWKPREQPILNSLSESA